MITILQGSVVTQTVLGGLTIYRLRSKFPLALYAKNYENWLEVDKVIAKIRRLTFWPTLYILQQKCLKRRIGNTLLGSNMMVHRS